MGEVAAGESIAEFALIGRFRAAHKFSVSCSALKYTEVYFLSRQVFDQFIDENPKKMVTFLTTAVARCTRSNFNSRTDCARCLQ